MKVFIDHAFGIRLPDGYKLAINRKKDNDVTICWHGVIVQLFWRCRVSLVTFNYWSKFHVNIMIGNKVITIFVYMGLTRNPEIGNTPVCVLPNICRLWRVKNTKFGNNVFNNKLQSTTKCQGYSFYHFWVIKGKPTGEVKRPSQPD